MNYTVFSDHTMGESHRKLGMDCEDYSGHYADPDGRFVLAVICDGHSDPKCFRSSAGARFGCETFLEVMRRWMELCLEEGPEKVSGQLQRNPKPILQRIRMAFVQKWNDKVRKDLRDNPVSEKEWESLDTPQYRTALNYYKSGKLLNNIYGATMLGAAACDAFHMAMQIGDGIVIKLEEGGFYTVPLEEDDKNEMEGPESMCDSDLLTREKAFRIAAYPGCPQAMYVTSDGVGDMPLTLQLRESLKAFQAELQKKAGDPAASGGGRELNEDQAQFLHSFVEYYSKRGVQDDCCLSGFYDPLLPVSDVYLSGEELAELYQNLENDRREREKRYLSTKDRLSKAFEQSQIQIRDLERQTGELKDQIRRLEVQLGILEEKLDREYSGRDNIRTIQNMNERDFEKSEAAYQEAKMKAAQCYGSRLQQTEPAAQNSVTESQLAEPAPQSPIAEAPQTGSAARNPISESQQTEPMTQHPDVEPEAQNPFMGSQQTGSAAQNAFAESQQTESVEQHPDTEIRPEGFAESNSQSERTDFPDNRDDLQPAVWSALNPEQEDVSQNVPEGQSQPQEPSAFTVIRLSENQE